MRHSTTNAVIANSTMDNFVLFALKLNKKMTILMNSHWRVLKSFARIAKQSSVMSVALKAKKIQIRRRRSL